MRLRNIIMVSTVLTMIGASSSIFSNEYCLPQSELSLGGIRVHASQQEVRKYLGTPLREIKGTSQDDGGDYSTVEMHYSNLKVLIGRENRVEEIQTSSSKVMTPSGVRVGQTTTKIAKRLHFPGLKNELPSQALSNLGYALANSLNLGWRA